LDDSTALVEYFLYDSLLFTFVISKSGYYIKETDAPPESLVQELNLAIFNTNKSVYLEKSFKLYTYLIEPIKRYVDNKKVVIIPSGYLHYVPFEALLTEKIINSDTPYTNLPYLIKKCNLQYYFSAHLLYQELNRNKISGFNTKLVAFAPVNFEQRAPAQLRGSNDMTLHLNSLPETEIELLEISKLFKQKNVDANLYLYSDATKEKFLSNSSNSACIHLATHASIDNTNIEKSWIAFSDTDSESFLRLGELYGLNLGSDLVVLSSCNSGQGEYKHGEGLVGFTRGFIYSGAQNVLVTLWEVDDQSTSKFMQSFYAAALSGKDYARALWEAKQEMIQHVDYADPYFWAPFVLMGTNGQLSLNQN
jgi:CHAT domain-containing protein